ncbi:carbon storage regulator, partial [Pseudoflavonifractor sp. 60]|nr:carbon storage regulator [Pseudoflavonifractor sp. 60]
QRERAVGRLEQVAQRLEENGSAEEAKFLRDQLSQIVPALWEDDLSIP